MNGTIVDDMAFHNRIWIEIWAELGHPITAEEQDRRFTGMTNAQTLREVLGEGITPEEIARLTRRKELAYQAAYREHMEPVAGLMDLLAAMREAGVPVAVATSANRSNIEFTLGGLGLWEWVTAVVGADDVTHGKPHPEIFLTAAATMGVSPENCLVFEDALMGFEAARRANMDAYAILTTLAEAKALALPNVVGAAPDFRTVSTSMFLRQGGNI
jgi:HAD superfamily hydrolase (TIGR01509 family)